MVMLKFETNFPLKAKEKPMPSPSITIARAAKRAKIRQNALDLAKLHKKLEQELVGMKLEFLACSGWDSNSFFIRFLVKNARLVNRYLPKKWVKWLERETAKVAKKTYEEHHRNSRRTKPFEKIRVIYSHPIFVDEGDMVLVRVSIDYMHENRPPKKDKK
jgi:hypothetical protein